jgi:hypothetical protein
MIGFILFTYYLLGYEYYIETLSWHNLTLWKRDYYDPAAATEIPVSYLLSFQIFIN